VKDFGDFIHQSLVFEHEQVRVENGSVLGAECVADFFLNVQDLAARLYQRALQAI
jgi:hypothetical protein